MSKDRLLNMAELEVETAVHSDSAKEATYKSGGKKLKLIFVCILFLVLAGTGWNAWNQIRRMNTPPDVPREVLLQNMGGYLFITVSKLNAYIERTGTVPETELEFLGWDDPSIEYTLDGGNYSVSVQSDDTVLVWHSGEDASEFLTEEALVRMGIAD